MFECSANYFYVLATYFDLLAQNTQAIGQSHNCCGWVGLFLHIFFYKFFSHDTFFSKNRISKKKRMVQHFFHFSCGEIKLDAYKESCRVPRFNVFNKKNGALISTKF